MRLPVIPLLLALLSIQPAGAQAPSPDLAAFRALFKELVETNTAQSTGSCSLAAQRMAAHLKAAGYQGRDLTMFSVPEYPKDGGLVAVLPGSDKTAKAMLLLAHLDVVEAKRADWQQDPFTLTEQDGKFVGRGTTDDKTQVAIWVDSLVRFRHEGYRPRRTIKMALTCGEEGGRFNGAKWLSENRRTLIDAAFALNEGGFITLDAQGRPTTLVLEAGEKTYQDIQLDVTNPGGHSSRPVKDNAIYHLAHALDKLQAYDFPIQLVDANRAYFSGMAGQMARTGQAELAAAITAMLVDPADLAAVATVAGHDPTWNATLRTTCVATLLEAGHAANALPQHASANVNCRMFPGDTAEAVLAQLGRVIDDPLVHLTALALGGPVAKASPLTEAVVGPVRSLASEMWPGIDILPILQPYATDGRFLTAAGIPTYGIDASLVDRNLNNMHGLNEFAGVQSLYRDREFLYRLIKAYADAPG